MTKQQITESGQTWMRRAIRAYLMAEIIFLVCIGFTLWTSGQTDSIKVMGYGLFAIAGIRVITGFVWHEK
tara:strand:- start:213 stop:422 length:210 start_codon:yes stop_codon:yes gene_type:complete